ncbi:flagellar export protein FliJ [Zobellella aerophila]|uniref:Flagellar FliJ protein n=1 Tax=Zobellella aerophila TaxID=870480 RepID=A0ABP6VW24_9GAMM
MSSPTPLDTLIELAREARDKAGQMLANERRNQAQLATQLQTLNRYRLEYAGRLQQLLHTGIDPATLHNYQQFLGSLDASIARAHQAVNQQHQRVTAGQQHWQQQQQRLSSYTTLTRRRADEHERRAQRNERRQSDEMTTNAQARRTGQGFTEQGS